MRIATTGLVATVLACAAAGAFAAQDTTRALFGPLPDGRKVEAITLRGTGGIQAVVINYGATLQSVVLPDRNGKLADVIVGPGSLQPYLEQPQYFGATVGRVANRIANGAFQLDGEAYQ